MLGVNTAILAASTDLPQRQEGKDFTQLKSRTTVYPAWFKDTFWDLNDDIREAVRAGKTGILIMTSTKTCSYCIAFIEKSLSVPEIEKRLRGQFDVLGLEVIADTEITDVDGKTYHVKDFLKKYKSYFTPALMFFGGDGSLLLNIAGYYPPERFKMVLDYIEGRHYKKQPWRAYAAARSNKSPSSAIITDPDLFAVSTGNLDRRLGKADKPLLVLFEKPDCSACSELHTQVLSVASTRNWISRFNAVQINAADTDKVLINPGGSRTTGKAWAEALDLAYYPSFVFFDEQGQEVFRIDTYTRNVRLEGTLELVLSKGYVDEPQLQRWRRQQFVREQGDKGQ